MGIEAVDADRKDAGAVLDAFRTIIDESIDIADAIDERADQVQVICSELFNPLLEDPRDAFAESDNANRIVTAGFIPIWHQFRLARLLADRAGAPFAGCADELFQTGADV